MVKVWDCLSSYVKLLEEMGVEIKMTAECFSDRRGLKIVTSSGNIDLDREGKIISDKQGLIVKGGK